jgi:hypothetical protein
LRSHLCQRIGGFAIPLIEQGFFRLSRSLLSIGRLLTDPIAESDSNQNGDNSDHSLHHGGQNLFA